MTLGTPRLHLASTDSTNERAKALAQGGAAHGTLVTAGVQTAGRGRQGRSWHALAGEALLMSLVLRETTDVLPIVAAVAVAETIGPEAMIKWPNDIVVGRSGRSSAVGGWRKIAGILAEGATTSGELQHVVLGYGVNLLRVEYPPEIAERATSIEQEIGQRIERTTVLVETLAALSQGYAALAEGHVDDVLARWRALSPSCEGAPVAWTGAAGRAVGVTAGIYRAGALLVRSGGGPTETIRSGEVTWL